jgi:hypothetical protein
VATYARGQIGNKTCFGYAFVVEIKRGSLLSKQVTLGRQAFLKLKEAEEDMTTALFTIMPIAHGSGDS